MVQNSAFNEIDRILATQLLVAWAGEGRSEPKRFGWRDTDLIDKAGGGDLVARLAPREVRCFDGSRASTRRVEERYVEVRKALLSQQSAEAEKAQVRIKVIPGFEQLTADQAHRVLTPILDAQIHMMPEAVSPTLLALREAFEAASVLPRNWPVIGSMKSATDQPRRRSSRWKPTSVAGRCRAASSFRRSSAN